MNQEPTPSPKIVAQARTQPNSWIYEFDGKFGPNDEVPREAIVGAWQVDAAGNIVGGFIRNPNHVRAPSKTDGADPSIPLPWQIRDSLRRP